MGRKQAQQPDAPLAEEFDLHDIVGIGFTVLGGILQNMGAGCGMISNELYSSARYRRIQRAEAREQVRNDMTFAELLSPMRVLMADPVEVRNDDES